MDIFINLELTENGRLLWPFPGKFRKISAKTTVIAGRSEQKLISASVTVLKHFIITKIFPGGTKLLRNCILKRDGETTLIFKISKTYQ